MKHNPERNRLIAELYSHLIPLKLIAQHFGVSLKHVEYIARKHGLRRYKCHALNSKNQQLELPLTFGRGISPTLRKFVMNTNLQSERLSALIAKLTSPEELANE
jgi:hypothetical protein